MSQPQNACSTSAHSADNDLLLRQVKIAAPCSVKWETMPGGERVRSCSQCSHKVYNLSAMSSDEAADLIREAEGRVCVRLYRRSDGSVMTRDCPTGLRAARLRVTHAVAASCASVLSILGLFSLAERFHSQPAVMMGTMRTMPQEVSTPESVPVMGKIAVVIDPTDKPVPVMGRPVPYAPSIPLPMVAPTPDAEKTFLPHESEPSEIRSDPFAPVTSKTNAAKLGTSVRP